VPTDGTSPALRDILGAADSSLALQYGSLAGLALAAFLCRVQGILSGAAIFQAAGSGMRIVLPAIAILWCASALSRMTGSKSVDGASSSGFEFKQHRLYTGDFLAELIMPSADSDSIESDVADSTLVKLLPTTVFLLAAVLSFSTGTSYGTMGLLMPMAITLTYSLLESQGGTVAPTNSILLASIAGVLSGAVFGDHCSPISDTTILSSQSCACDHISHVLTQLPYALAVGSVSILLGTLPLGWGVSIWLLLPLQVVAMVAILMLVGKKVDDVG
jgi:Na+/H+ antiporter NhaC